MPKSKSTLLFFIIILLGSACQKEETCVSDNLTNVILGTWTVSGDKSGTITFVEDGTIIDNDNCLLRLFDEENGFPIDSPFTYSVPDNTLLEIYVVEPFGMPYLGLRFEVSEFDCKEIKMRIFFSRTEVLFKQE